MRLLILGGNGMIGHKMVQVLSKEYPDIYTTQRSPKIHQALKEILDAERILTSVHLESLETVNPLLDKIAPDVVINAVGVTIRRAKIEPEVNSILINAAMPHLLATWCVKHGKRMIHFSTDCVFSGKKGNYSEEDVPDALDLYGKSKGLGEVINYPGVLTLRGSMIGRELENKTELLEWFLSQSGGQIKGFSKAIYSGITTVRMAHLIKQMLYTNSILEGLYNVSSAPISKFALLALFNDAFRTKTGIIEENGYSTQKDLISDRFYKKMGLEVPEWKDLIAELAEDSFNNKHNYEI
jgi:dTDP-4-dehydrorhamnose reductase